MDLDWLREATPIQQGLAGTFFTWFVTALGAGLVFLCPRGSSPATRNLQQAILDSSLGFAGGVMVAASFWSMLSPAIEISEESWGKMMAWCPSAVGILTGALFVYLSEVGLEKLGLLGSPEAVLKKNDDMVSSNNHSTWRRVLLLVVAITVHNFPEGLAVGVAFGGLHHVEYSSTYSFSDAVSVTIGTAIQNFPEGLAVSMPLHRAGFGYWTSFFWGQISGAVEPLGGLLGAAAVAVVKPLLPYALAFAAGAMIYVVIDDIIPETSKSKNARISAWAFMLGFVVMMTLDVALG